MVSIGACRVPDMGSNPVFRTTSTRVVNVRYEDFDVYIGRWNPRFPHEPSYKWGNPFKLGRDGSISEVLKKYEQYVRSKPELMRALPELAGKRLGCWCKPEPCHGNVLVKLLSELNR